MFDLACFLFCNTTAKDERGNISLLGTFDNVIFPSLPARLSPFRGVLQCTALKETINQEVDVRILIQLEDKEFSTQEFKVKVLVEKDNLLNIDIDFSPLAFEVAGKYTFTVFLDEKKIARRVLRIRLESELNEV